MEIIPLILNLHEYVNDTIQTKSFLMSSLNIIYFHFMLINYTDCYCYYHEYLLILIHFVIVVGYFRNNEFKYHANKVLLSFLLLF